MKGLEFRHTGETSSRLARKMNVFGFLALAVAGLTAPSLLQAATVIDTTGNTDTFTGGSNSGWSDVSPDTGVTFVGGEALVGRPGPSGIGRMDKEFSANLGANQKVRLTFDYTWGASDSDPSTNDAFDVLLDGTSIFSDDTTGLTFNSSSDPAFRSVTETVSTTFTPDDDSNFELSFSLNEVSDGPNSGTLVAVDNVSLTVVPIPAAAWLFGTALLGVAVVARRRDGTGAGPMAASA